MIKACKNVLRALWAFLRQASGDDAYERYLLHWRQEHANSASPPLDKKQFYLAEIQRKWAKMQRCC